MKILLRKENNIAIIQAIIITLEDSNNYRCDDVIFSNCTPDNCEVIDNVTLPPKFVGGCYTYENGVWACVNTAQVEIAYPTPTISMRQSRLELLNRGLLDAVESHVATLSKSAQIEWEYSVEVRRDYPLVVELATLLNLSESDLDDFFDSAKLI